MNTSDIIRVLHVDDDVDFLATAKLLLTELHSTIQVETAQNYAEALTKLSKGNYDIVISDYEMPQNNGLHLLQEMHKQKINIPFILFTGKGKEEVIIKALNLGADAYHSKQGSPELVYSELVHDIKLLVEKKKITKELRRQQEQFTKLVNQTPGMLYQFLRRPDGSYCVPFATQHIRQIFGCSPEDVTEDFAPIAKVILPEDLKIVIDSIEQSAQNLTCWECEYRVLLSGEVRWMWGRSFPEKQPDGSILWSGFNQDVTARKVVEENQRQVVDILEKVGEGVDVGLAVISKDYRVIWANKRLMAMGVSPYKRCYEVFKKLVDVCPDCGVHKILEGHTDFDIHEYQGVNENGEPFWIELRVTPFKENGVIIGALELAIDITERKKKQEELKRVASKLEAVIANSPIGIATTDVEHKICSANKEFCKIIGYTEEELKRMSFRDFTHPDDEVENSIINMSKLSAGSIENFSIERRHIRKDGAVRYGKVTLSAVRDVSNRPTLYIAQLQDITEKKQAEEELRQNMLQYRLLADNTKDVIWTMDLNGFFTYVSPSVFELRGYTPKEVMKQSLNEALTPQSASKVIEVIDNFFKTGEFPLGLLELEQPCKDGSTVWTEINLTVIKDGEGKPKSILGVSRDISERKQVHKELELLLKEREALLEATHSILGAEEFVVSAREIFDVCKGLIGATAGYVALLSDDGSENKVLFLDSGGLECTVNPSLPMPIRGLRETAYTKKVVVYENNFVDSEWIKFMPAGHARLANVMFVPLVVDGRVVGLLGLANKPNGFNDRDSLVATAFGEYVAISLRNSCKSQDNERHRKKLEFLNEKLSIVGGFIRHDIKNKLAIIKARSFILKTKFGKDNPELLKNLQAIDLAVNQSDELFEFGHIYQKVGFEELIETDVFEAFNEAVALIPNLSIEVVNNCDCLRVKADSMLRQLFYNLLSNSIKHGKKVKKTQLRFEDAPSTIRLIYEDDGVGISYEDKKRLFQEGFSTGGGLGLGLKLVKSLVDVYSWSISEEGVPGEGVKFVISVPKKPLLKKCAATINT